MFRNIGAKIKGIAQFITWIGIIPTIVLFCILASSGEGRFVAIGFVILIIGVIISWLSSILLYAFGHLVENSDTIAENSTLNNTKQFASEKERIAYLLQNGKISQIEYNKRLLAIMEQENSKHAEF